MQSLSLSSAAKGPERAPPRWNQYAEMQEASTFGSSLQLPGAEGRAEKQWSSNPQSGRVVEALV